MYALNLLAQSALFLCTIEGGPRDGYFWLTFLIRFTNTMNTILEARFDLIVEVSLATFKIKFFLYKKAEIG